MDENTYIKYLDSFLMGYAMLDYCILADSGKYLKEVYEKQTDYTTMQSYLLDYRNTYFSNSLIGPFRSESELKRALNRAIRYDIGEFNSVYKNSNVGSADDTKMDKIVKGVVDEIKAEQGVTFTYELSYGSYKLTDGTEGKGWIIGFTKKD
jgi:anion-transporting  ArsA/GET3 family ATPase